MEVVVVVVVVVVVDVVVVVVVTVDEVISPLIGSGDVSHSGGMVRGGSVGSAKYQKIISDRQNFPDIQNAVKN